jgi:hypothetical protein
MKERDITNNNLIEKCKLHLNDFCNTLEGYDYSKEYIKFIKTNILLFLEEFSKKRDVDNYFNSSFINNYLSKTIPIKFPDYSKNKIIKIQAILKKFVNYLTMQKILNTKINQEIFRNLYKKTELKKELDKNSNLNNNMITNLNSIKIKEIIQIKNDIINFSLNLNDYTNDELKFNQVIYYFEKKPEILVVDAILELFKTIDDSIFFRILFFIDTFLKIDILPSSIVKIITLKSKQDIYFFRLLILYQTFFNSGYILEKPFPELIKDLNVDEELFFKYVASAINYIDNGQITSLFENVNYQEEIEDILDVEKFINDIIPFNENSPYLNVDDYELFKLPKGINLELQKHINFLNTISNSYLQKIKFINSSWDDFKDYFSSSQEKSLMKEAKKLYYKGKFQKALFFINKLLKICSDSAVALYFKGKLLGEQKKYYNAIKYHLKSLNIDPYKIETYMDLSFLLEIGGYFHSSALLTSLLLRFCPFDFNFHIQLAISSCQILKPFKDCLRLAGSLDPGRLINFLTRFWVYERIKPRDSLKNIGISPNKINELLNSAELIVLNALKVVRLQGTKYKDEKYIENLHSRLKNSQYFFPNNEDHIMKNWFAYELAIRLAHNFYVLYYKNNMNLSYLILSEEFIMLCFELSKITSDQILTTLVKRKNSFSFEIDTETILENEKLKKTPIFEFFCFFISIDAISAILIDTVTKLITECDTCPNRCLRKPFKWCVAFYTFGKVNSDSNNHSNAIQFIDYLNNDFEIFLKDKGLQEKTIDKKVENVEFFLTYLINIIKYKEDPFIEQNLERYINSEVFPKFLGYYIIKNKIILTQTSMKEMCRSLKTFISFLYNDYGYFDKVSFNNLNKVLNSSEFFIKRLKNYQECFTNEKNQEMALKEWSTQFLKWNI